MTTKQTTRWNDNSEAARALRVVQFICDESLVESARERLAAEVALEVVAADVNARVMLVPSLRRACRAFRAAHHAAFRACVFTTALSELVFTGTLSAATVFAFNGLWPKPDGSNATFSATGVENVLRFFLLNEEEQSNEEFAARLAAGGVVQSRGRADLWHQATQKGKGE